MLLSILLCWGTKGGIGYLLPQHWNKGLQLFTKVKCYFQDDEGPFIIIGNLATRSFLIILIWLLFFIYFVFESYFFISFDLVLLLYSNMLLLWFLVIPWGPLYRWKSNLWQLAEFLLGGNSLVPHDLLKRSWLWKQMRDNSTHFTLSDMGPEVFSSFLFRRDPEVSTRW